MSSSAAATGSSRTRGSATEVLQRSRKGSRRPAFCFCCSSIFFWVADDQFMLIAAVHCLPPIWTDPGRGRLPIPPTRFPGSSSPAFPRSKPGPGLIEEEGVAANLLRGVPKRPNLLHWQPAPFARALWGQYASVQLVCAGSMCPGNFSATVGSGLLQWGLAVGPASI